MWADKIHIILNGPITWGVITLILAALAGSGRFGVNLSNILLIFAFLVGCFGIFRSTYGIHISIILSLSLGIILTLISWWIYPNLPTKQSIDVFKCNFIVTVKFNYPGPLFIVYPSALGNTMSFPNLALYVEVVNNGPTVTRIFDYECRMLLRYDDGGTTEEIKTPGGLKYKYTPAGKPVEKWQKLRSMGFISDNVYYVMNDNLKKCRRLNFNENSFDKLASNTQLLPGQSIKGWIFLEFESSELTFQLPEIKEIELTIHNSVGSSETCRSIQDETKPPDNAKSVISAGDWKFEAGEYDFTKDKYTAVRMIDLPDIVKNSTNHKR